MKMTKKVQWIVSIGFLLSGLLSSGCKSGGEGVRFSMTYDNGDLVLRQDDREDQRLTLVDDDNEGSYSYIQLVGEDGGLVLAKKTIPDDPEEIPWLASASRPVRCDAENAFSFRGRYTVDSIFFPMGNTNSEYGLAYGAAGEEVCFYRQASVVYTFEAPQLNATPKVASKTAPSPKPAPSAAEDADSTLFIVNCGIRSIVLDGGSSIIHIIDNIYDFNTSIADTAAGRFCNATGESDFTASKPIMIPLEKWRNNLKVAHHCLFITLPDQTQTAINLITCQVKLSFVGANLIIRSGCPVNTTNCCGQ